MPFDASYSDNSTAYNKALNFTKILTFGAIVPSFMPILIVIMQLFSDGYISDYYNSEIYYSVLCILPFITLGFMLYSLTHKSKKIKFYSAINLAAWVLFPLFLIQVVIAYLGRFQDMAVTVSLLTALIVIAALVVPGVILCSLYIFRSKNIASFIASILPSVSGIPTSINIPVLLSGYILLDFATLALILSSILSSGISPFVIINPIIIIPGFLLGYCVLTQVKLAKAILARSTRYQANNITAFKAMIVLPAIAAVFLLFAFFVGGAMNDSGAPIGSYVTYFAFLFVVVALFALIAFIQFRYISKSKNIKAICTK